MKNDTRDGSDTEPRGWALVLFSLVFFLIVLTAEIGAAWLAVVGWHGWRRANRMPGRVWFWLSYSVDCAWCKRRLHRAWIPLPRVSREFPFPRVSHTACRECYAEFIRGVESSAHPTMGSPPKNPHARSGAGLSSLNPDHISKQFGSADTF